jgi:hypothetical protein
MLVQNPIFACSGFYKGFGKTLFNMVLVQKLSENRLVRTFLKLHMLGVRDPHFLQLAHKLIDQNALSFSYQTPIYIIMYNWWKLGQRKVHREAVRSRIEFFMNSTSLENRVNTISRVHSPYLTHYLLAVCDN